MKVSDIAESKHVRRLRARKEEHVARYLRFIQLRVQYQKTYNKPLCSDDEADKFEQEYWNGIQYYDDLIDKYKAYERAQSVI